MATTKKTLASIRTRLNKHSKKKTALARPHRKSRKSLRFEKLVPGLRPKGFSEEPPSRTPTRRPSAAQTPVDDSPDTPERELLLVDNDDQDTPTDFDGTPLGTGEKLKTSLLIDHTILAQSKQIARSMGLSFNAYATLALHSLNQQQRMALGQSAFLPRRVDVEMDGRTLLTQKFGETMTIPGDEDQPTMFVPWDIIERYARYAGDHPTANWQQVGHALGITAKEARAADLAVESDEFKRYIRAKYGRQA